LSGCVSLIALPAGVIQVVSRLISVVWMIVMSGHVFRAVLNC
jgi:hypothetical protein